MVGQECARLPVLFVLVVFFIIGCKVVSIHNYDDGHRADQTRRRATRLLLVVLEVSIFLELCGLLLCPLRHARLGRRRD